MANPGGSAEAAGEGVRAGPGMELEGKAEAQAAAQKEAQEAAQEAASEEALLRAALKKNRQCQAALHALLAEVEMRERTTKELIRRMRTLRAFATRMRKGKGGLLKAGPGLAAGAHTSSGTAAAAAAPGAAQHVFGGHASEMLLVSWKRRRRRGRKNKYTYQDEDLYDPAFADDSALDARFKDMPRVSDADKFEMLRAVIPPVFHLRKWAPCEVAALAAGVKQQVQQRLLECALADATAAARAAGSAPHGQVALQDAMKAAMKRVAAMELTPVECAAAAPYIDWKAVAHAYVNPAAKTLGRGAPFHRTPAECFLRWRNVDDPALMKGPWSEAEELKLKAVAERHGLRDWEAIARELALEMGAKEVPLKEVAAAFAIRGSSPSTGAVGGTLVYPRRAELDCLSGYQQWWNPSIMKREWCAEEDRRLVEVVKLVGEGNWAVAAQCMRGRSMQQCSTRWHNNLKKVRRERWTHEENERLRLAVGVYGRPNWNRIATLLPGRTEVQCRERWCNILDPALNFGDWTEDEDQLLNQAVARHGTHNWAAVAAHVWPRTDAQCRKRWSRLNPGALVDHALDLSLLQAVRPPALGRRRAYGTDSDGSDEMDGEASGDEGAEQQGATDVLSGAGESECDEAGEHREERADEGEGGVPRTPAVSGRQAGKKRGRPRLSVDMSSSLNAHDCDVRLRTRRRKAHFKDPVLALPRTPMGNPGAPAASPLSGPSPSGPSSPWPGAKSPGSSGTPAGQRGRPLPALLLQRQMSAGATSSIAPSPGGRSPMALSAAGRAPSTDTHGSEALSRCTGMDAGEGGDDPKEAVPVCRVDVAGMGPVEIQVRGRKWGEAARRRPRGVGGGVSALLHHKPKSQRALKRLQTRQRQELLEFLRREQGPVRLPPPPAADVAGAPPLSGPPAADMAGALDDTGSFGLQAEASVHMANGEMAALDSSHQKISESEEREQINAGEATNNAVQSENMLSAPGPQPDAPAQRSPGDAAADKPGALQAKPKAGSAAKPKGRSTAKPKGGSAAKPRRAKKPSAPSSTAEAASSLVSSGGSGQGPVEQTLPGTFLPWMVPPRVGPTPAETLQPPGPGQAVAGPPVVPVSFLPAFPCAQNAPIPPLLPFPGLWPFWGPPPVHHQDVALPPGPPGAVPAASSLLPCTEPGSCPPPHVPGAPSGVLPAPAAVPPWLASLVPSPGPIESGPQGLWGPPLIPAPLAAIPPAASQQPLPGVDAPKLTPAQEGLDGPFPPVTPNLETAGCANGCARTAPPLFLLLRMRPQAGEDPTGLSARTREPGGQWARGAGHNGQAAGSAGALGLTKGQAWRWKRVKGWRGPQQWWVEVVEGQEVGVCGPQPGAAEASAPVALVMPELKPLASSTPSEQRTGSRKLELPPEWTGPNQAHGGVLPEFGGGSAPGEQVQWSATLGVPQAFLSGVPTFGGGIAWLQRPSTHVLERGTPGLPGCGAPVPERGTDGTPEEEAGGCGSLDPLGSGAPAGVTSRGESCVPPSAGTPVERLPEGGCPGRPVQVTGEEAAQQPAELASRVSLQQYDTRDEQANGGFVTRDSLQPDAQTTAAEAPGEQGPGEQAPVEQAPGEQASGEEAPAEQVPWEQAPGEQASGEQAPAEHALGVRTPEGSRIRPGLQQEGEAEEQVPNREGNSGEGPQRNRQRGQSARKLRSSTVASRSAVAVQEQINGGNAAELKGIRPMEPPHGAADANSRGHGGCVIHEGEVVPSSICNAASASAADATVPSLPVVTELWVKPDPMWPLAGQVWTRSCCRTRETCDLHQGSSGHEDNSWNKRLRSRVKKLAVKTAG